MTPVSPVEVVRPLPLLPMEVKKEILRFCDPSTLATTCGVSLAFLEMAAPLLYRHVVIIWQDLHRLFSPRTSARKPAIECWLSLDLIQTLQVRQVVVAPQCPLELSLDRSSTGLPLAVLELALDPVLPGFFGTAGLPIPGLFACSNPSRLRVCGPLYGSGRHMYYGPDDSWTRLETMSFVDGGSNTLAISDWLEETGLNVRIHHHLSRGPTIDSEGHNLADWLQDRQKWVACVAGSDLELKPASISRVRITVECKDDEKYILDCLRERGRPEKFGDKLVVEVVPRPAIAT